MSENSELSKMVDARNAEIQVLNETVAQHVATIDTCNANIAQLQNIFNVINMLTQNNYNMCHLFQ